MQFWHTSPINDYLPTQLPGSKAILLQKFTWLNKRESLFLDQRSLPILGTTKDYIWGFMKASLGA